MHASKCCTEQDPCKRRKIYQNMGVTTRKEVAVVWLPASKLRGVAYTYCSFEVQPSFSTSHPNLKYRSGQSHRRNLDIDSSLDAQTRQSPSYEASCFRFCRHSSFHRASSKRIESVIGKDEDSSVVGFEVVDLLAENGCPEVFAEEFDRVKRIRARWERKLGRETVIA